MRNPTSPRSDLECALILSSTTPMRPSVVAHRMGWTTQRASAALRQAEALGLAKRVPNPVIVRLNRFGSPVYRDTVGYVSTTSARS